MALGCRATARALSSWARIRMGSVAAPRMMSQALKGLRCQMGGHGTKQIHLFVRSTTAPPIASPCPQMYFVSDWITKSAPSSIGES